MIVKITGIKETLAALDKLEKKIRNKTIREALRAGAKPMLKAMKALCPVDEGALKKSIKIRAIKRKKNRLGFMVGSSDKDYSGKTYYGAFLEYGVRNKDGTFKISPRRFHKHAFDSTKQQSLKIVREHLINAIQNLAA